MITLAANRRRKARALARDVVDRYFDALLSQIPFDNAPGDVDLITETLTVQEELRLARESEGIDDDGTADAMTAGFFVGVEIGLRLRGVR
jgi:hypothetical protein